MTQTYQERMQAEAARQAKIAEQQEQRRQELDGQAQLEQERAQRRATQAAADAAFHARVEATRGAWERGERPAAVPSLAELMTQKRDEVRAARAQAEQERLAAITPRQSYISSLPHAAQRRIKVYEDISGLAFPIPGFEE